MENYSFKTAAFGGFDKQDVVRYLEQTAEKNAALQRRHEEETERLREEAEELRAQMEELEKRVEELSVQRDELQSRLEKEAAAQESLQALKRDVSRLTAERDALRPDAEAYARFRMKLGDIECEARNRAEDLEEAAAVQTQRTAETFQSQYRKLMETFNAAARHVTRELQGIQDALDLLPRNMDGTETELNELLDCMQRGRNGRSDYLINKRAEPEEGPLQEEGPEPFRAGEEAE